MVHFYPQIDNHAFVSAAYLLFFVPKAVKHPLFRLINTLKKKLSLEHKEGTAPLQLETGDSPCQGHLLYSKDKRNAYLQILETVLTDQKPFLTKGYSIKDLAEDTGIPAHHLSCLINKEYQLNFQNFINFQRVEYVKSQIHQEEWKQLSLEGMAWQAGFTSRTTFFRAFIKNTGKAPSYYLGDAHHKL
ncbi:AraC family transcriptional regulator [Pedobacter sp. N36a]|uniref:helix-turn-helix domain-containing protein n=1 Tax=Pedobacter sp. N36a TaxID=2767996 RepID=UPI00165725B6|nr:helix-turn-helix domain-containing protein [Pedobacter sp. N36a]MBC8987595.1 AraC family transcriptional regulator [Pedobacter sp. N36a]